MILVVIYLGFGKLSVLKIFGGSVLVVGLVSEILVFIGFLYIIFVRYFCVFGESSVLMYL